MDEIKRERSQAAVSCKWSRWDLKGELTGLEQITDRPSWKSDRLRRNCTWL